ncbi:chemotaxis protein CheA [Sanguibacter sp. HDW7]|uniref:chemotaxis protein CheA n=1 Tax=Sanguibacter sp. HDW7 TaxID=2714931 RepID=UPI0014096CFB|nr:chemotaxis protein CheA [Sanguibacter sp. HDW7]QIK84288.1 chemotaxis protein CheA [Sanguibacter sp. HDW7]
MEGIDEIVREFLIESTENLDQLDRDLVALESDPGSRELLGSIFRTIHTIKGTSGFLSFHALESVTHVGESLLVELRGGERQMDQPTTDVLLEMVDTVRAILERIEESSLEDGVETEAVVARIQRMLDGVAEPVDASEPAVAAERVDAVVPEDVAEPVEELVAVAAAPTQAAVSVATATPVVGASRVAPRSRGARADVHAATTTVAQPPAQVAGGATRSASVETSIRVDVELLDELMRQVGELVIVRNQIAQNTGRDTDPELLRSAQRLSTIATELQEGVMKTRMQPIEHVWSKMPRVVRDLANGAGKQVDLEMVGGETELDRSLLEAVKDPLTHLVRNAVDHGIETPEQREAAGKPRPGRLVMRAYHAGGQVVVEVRDDGRGIDPEKVAAKALQRGLRTVEQLDAMSVSELQSLVFLPGFSTAETVTNVSGRGVGMDVVRANLEEIGGQVDVESEVGTGTVWRLRIPLTLAIMPALTVVSGTEIYAIPQVSLLELVALDTARTVGSIEHVGASEVYRLRGELLPLVRLRDVLRTPGDAGSSMVIAVLRADNLRFGLVVDRVLNTEEIVVKPLASQLRAAATYAGATLMGNGRVALILDVQAIARRSLVADLVEQVGTVVSAAVTTTSTRDLLVVALDENRRAAIPLDAVTRLEQIDPSRIEVAGHREVLRYRGAILPVLRLSSVLGAEPAGEGPLDVVVFTRGARSVAMVVGAIVEIVADTSEERRVADTHGIVELVSLGGRVTELVDLPVVLGSADPGYFSDPLPVDGDVDADSLMAVAS